MQFINIILVLFYLLNYEFLLTSGQSNDEIEEYGDCRPLFTHNYGYKIYFNLPKSAIVSNRSILFEFSVQASSDAHVLFTATSNPKDTQPVYEVVLGAGWNTFSDIRRLYVSPQRTTNITKNILDKNKLKKFWIKINDGAISLGEGGVSKPFLQWKDRNPVPVKFISFSSWHGTQAKWYFDCYGRKSILATNMTIGEKLRNYLLDNYDPYTQPATDDDRLTVNSNLYISYVSLDPVTSSMELRGSMDVSWNDEKLKWDPAEFGQIKLIKLTERKIWQPTLHLLNDVNINLNWFNQGIVTISHEGGVNWATSVHWITRCILDMSEWPEDQHVCNVQVGYSDQRSIVLSDLQDITLENGREAGEWQVLAVKGKSTYMLPLYTDTDSLFGPMQQLGYESGLNIELKLKRYSSQYYYTLHIPLKVCILISLVTLCLSYRSGYRLILQVIVIVMIVINLLSIDSSLPSTINCSPNILLLGNSLLLVNILSTLVTVVLVHYSTRKQALNIPAILESSVDYMTLRFSFFFASVGERKLENLEEEDEEEKQNIANYKMTEKQRNQAFLLIIDYILFTSVTFTYIILGILY